MTATAPDPASNLSPSLASMSAPPHRRHPPSLRWGYSVIAAHDHDGALGVVRAVLADRPEQRIGERAVPAAADHEKIRVRGRVDEHGGGIAFDHPPLDRDRAVGPC